VNLVLIILGLPFMFCGIVWAFVREAFTKGQLLYAILTGE
jgi:hypothetical protein